MRLGGGNATISVPAGSLAAGTDMLTVNYSGDSVYGAASGSNTVTVTAPGFTIDGSAITVTAGAVIGNVSTVSLTPAGGFTGDVALTATVTAGPSGAQYPPTFNFGSTSQVMITGSGAGTALLTISTTANGALAASRRPQGTVYAAGGAVLACILFFGIPARRRCWCRMLGMLALLIALSGGMLACGGGGTGGGGGGSSIPGTSAGTYTVTVSGTSGAITETGTVSLTVQTVSLTVQ